MNVLKIITIIYFIYIKYKCCITLIFIALTLKLSDLEKHRDYIF